MNMKDKSLQTSKKALVRVNWFFQFEELNSTDEPLPTKLAQRPQTLVN